MEIWLVAVEHSFVLDGLLAQTGLCFTLIAPIAKRLSPMTAVGDGLPPVSGA